MKKINFSIKCKISWRYILEIKKVKTIITKDEDKNSEPFVFIDGFDNDFFDDKVALYSKNYEIIFNKKLKELDHKPWKRGIVKISSKTKNNSIYRIYFGAKLAADELGLNKYNKNMLGIGETTNVKIEKGNKFLFYWDHPSHIVRSAFKLGFLSLLLTIVSLLISIVSIFFKMGIDYCK